MPKPSSRLCSLHFRASDYKGTGRRLKDSAIPTVSIDMDVSEDELVVTEDDFTGVVTEGKKSYSRIDAPKDAADYDFG